MLSLLRERMMKAMSTRYECFFGYLFLNMFLWLKDSTRHTVEIVLYGDCQGLFRHDSCTNDTCPWGPKAPTAGQQTGGEHMHRF